MDAFLQSALDAIEEAAGTLDARVMARPVAGRWSIAEILEHLTLAFTANATGLEKALASGELRARTPRFRQRLARVLVVDVGFFPRVEAPEMTRPRASIPPDRALAAICDALTTLDTALTRVAARFGEAVAVSNHPYFAGLTVRQWRKFHWRHTVHHMRQVRARAGTV
ncbi:MAG: DUF1569 domain-containing protein [Acidobacteria bacterium]|nr:DUF1569 domain-containing protein [Acidobacteriota bacterium]MCA1651756.1 DUF1569 domain-containing protein [Acidobacteriota bacterium]